MAEPVYEFSAEKLRHVIEQGNLAFKQNAISFIFHCPKCQKKDKLYMRKADGRFVCWVCKETENFQGRCEYALVELFGGKLSDYRKFIYGSEGPLENYLDLDLVDHWGEAEDPDLWFESYRVGYEWPSHFYGWGNPAFKPGAMYLASRGIGLSVITKYDIRYCRADNRVIFPFVVDGELLGWQGRICGPTEKIDTVTGNVIKIPKAMTYLQDHVAGRYVMFGDNLRDSPHCVLTEGPIDALKAELCGGNVAALGKAVSTYQIDWIAERVKRLYVAVDPDACDEMTRIIREASSHHMETFLMVPPPGKKDFGECTPQEVLECFHAAKPVNGNTAIINLGGELYF